MKIEFSEFYKKNEPFLLEMPFGKYYFFEKFILSEMFEGIHFDWNKAVKLIPSVHTFYGKNAQIGFISNRVNRYSVDPQNWAKLEKEYSFIAAASIVVYDKPNYMNATIEKHFAKKSIKRSASLTEAIAWVLNLKELN